MREEARQKSEGRQVVPFMYDRPAGRLLFLSIDKEGRALGTSLAEKGDHSISLPARHRSSNIEPFLLSDNGSYVFGVGKKGSERHAEFKELAEECSTALNIPSVDAIVKFLENPQVALPDDYKHDSDRVVFKVANTYPTDLARVQEYWASKIADDTETQPGTCLICRQQTRVVGRIPLKVSYLGMTLVSANSQAYASDGFNNTYTSPICLNCAEKATKGLDSLLRSTETHSITGDVHYLYWTTADSDAPVENLFEPDPNKVRELINAYKTGKKAVVFLDDRPYYFAVLVKGKSRFSLRAWEETTLGVVRLNVARWFAMQEIDFQEERYLGLGDILELLFRHGDRKISSNEWGAAKPLAQAIARTALEARPLPYSLLLKSVNRAGILYRKKRPGKGLRAELRYLRDITILLKAALAGVGMIEEGDMVGLDESREDPAYLCGRLLAILDDIQYAALPEVNVTLAAKSFGAALTTPRYILPDRVKMATQAYLPKIKKGEGGAYNVESKRLTGVLDQLDGFPAFLDPDGQAAFVLGFYHEKAAKWARIEEAKNKSKSKSKN